MHTEAWEYLRRQREIVNPKGLEILEIGSINVNGSARDLFGQGAKRYHGIDLKPGRNVDQVIDARELGAEEEFDLVITTETLEHDANAGQIIEAAYKALRPGGMLILTAAADGRAAHNGDGSPYTGQEPYQNVSRAMLEAWLDVWAEVSIEIHEQHRDIYATARKPAGEETDAEQPKAKRGLTRKAK